MVKEPGPNTLRIQVALTGVSEGAGTEQFLTSIIPVGFAVSLVQDFATKKPSFAGDMSVESRVTDASTGELIAAAVDRRIAAKSIATAFSTWKQLTEITETWAEMFAYRLCMEQGGTDCVKRKE
jgi:Protein of unknown function (DUF3313)